MTTNSDAVAGQLVRGVRPRAWLVEGHLLSGPDGGAVWHREPNEHDRQTWSELGLDVRVTPLCGPEAVEAERERIRAAVTRCTLLAENCEGDSPEVDTARKALACTILAAIAGYEAPAPAGTQQGLLGA